MYAATGADALNQLARLGQVLDATARALPATPSAIAAQLRAVGLSSTSTLGATRLSSLLAGFAAADRRSGLYATDLPVTSVDAGGGGPSYRVDAAGTKSLVTGHLAASVRPGAATGPTVELLNGVGTPGLVATACPKLASAGLIYAGSDNAGSFNNPHSTVAVPTADLDAGYQVAAALGLPRSDVRRTTEDQTVAEVVVTLGADYQP
jgi:hypothetical protein